MKKSLLVFALFLAFIYSVGGIYFYFFDNEDTKVVKNISEIKKYDYKLKSNASNLLKTEFNVLKANLESDKIDDKEYAISVAKLFIIDLYTLNNKVNKYDVGGSDYVFPSSLENYKLNVTDTMYKHIEDNSSGKRKQELPEVTSINLNKIAETEFKIDDKTYEGYEINLSWTYLVDLEYDESGDIIVVKENNKYFVTEKK